MSLFRRNPRPAPGVMTREEHAARIRAIGFPAVITRIAFDGGASVHPLLRHRADELAAPVWSIAARHPELVPLWGAGTVAYFASADGVVTRWSAEYPDEPLRVHADLTAAVRAVLTDIWETDDDGRHEAERVALAHLLLPPERVATALVPQNQDEAYDLATLLRIAETDAATAELVRPGLVATLRHARAFEYEVTQGGFAQLLYNARGAGLPEIEDALIAMGATRAQDGYVAAIRHCLADREAYAAFLATPFTTATALRDALQGLSIDYLTGSPALAEETETWRATTYTALLNRGMESPE